MPLPSSYLLGACILASLWSSGVVLDWGGGVGVCSIMTGWFLVVRICYATTHIYIYIYI